MTMEEVFSHTFKAISKRLDERRAEGRRLWQQRQGTASEFCRALVSNGYLSEEQMQRAARRYRLGASLVRDSKTDHRYLKLVNAMPDPLVLKINGLSLPEGAKAETFCGKPKDQQVELKPLSLRGSQLPLPPYSFIFVASFINGLQMSHSPMSVFS